MAPRPRLPRSSPARCKTAIALDGHGALRLTTARYYTPAGRSIQGEGITPDVLVLPPREQQIAQATVLHETDLRGALKNTGPQQGGQGGVDSLVAATPTADQDSEAAAIDPAIIGTAKDHQLAVALKRIKEMVARSATGGHS